MLETGRLMLAICFAVAFADTAGATEYHFASCHAKPGGCAQGIKVMVPPTQVANRRILAVAMAACASGSSVSPWGRGGSSAYGTTFPMAFTSSATL
jgi:hypothetical protein